MCKTVCLCYCHDTDLELNAGVDVANVIDAAIACTLCRNSHCAALLDHPAPGAPRIDERTPDERAEAWEKYQREQRNKRGEY